MENWWTMIENKKFKNPIILFISICIIFIALFSYFHHKKQIVITFGMFAGSAWDVPYSNCYGTIDKTIAKFENEHPNVKIKYINGIMKEDYSEWLSEKLLKGQAPDVFMILPEDFNALSNAGAMKDLNTYIARDNNFDSSRFYKTSFECGKYENKQYALPYESVPTMMFVNKTLLEHEGIKVPDSSWTFNDFYNICSKVTKDTDGNGVIDQFGSCGYTWKDAVYSNGGVLFNENGTKSYFKNKKVEDSINFVKKLNELNNGYNVTSADFDNGRVAFHPLLFSEYTTYKTYPWKIKKFSGFEWECIKMPAGKYGNNVSEVKTLSIGINSNTKESNLSWEFLKMLTYDENVQKQIFNSSQGVSVLKSVTNSREVLDMLGKNAPNGTYINMSLLNDVMENGVVSPRFRKYQSVMEMSDNMINQSLSGSDENLTYDLAKVQKEADNILKKQ